MSACFVIVFSLGMFFLGTSRSLAAEAKDYGSVLQALEKVADVSKVERPEATKLSTEVPVEGPLEQAKVDESVADVEPMKLEDLLAEAQLLEAETLAGRKLDSPVSGEVSAEPEGALDASVSKEEAVVEVTEKVEGVKVEALAKVELAEAKEVLAEEESLKEAVAPAKDSEGQDPELVSGGNESEGSLEGIPGEIVDEKAWLHANGFRAEALSVGGQLIKDGLASLDLTKEDNSLAEQTLLNALRYELTEKELSEVLLTLGLIYNKTNVVSKEVIIYEQFLEKLPNDPSRPEVFIRLGRLYRGMGVYDMAIDRFYGVINMSLSIGEKDMKLYRRLTQEAQLEIADTYFMTKEFSKAAILFHRLKTLTLDPKEREHVEFKEAYSYFNLKNYGKAIVCLTDFIGKYRESSLAPECQYILANAYRLSGQSEKAVQTVLELVQVQVDKNSPNRSVWDYWKKKTANQLANGSYEARDYSAALRVYQAMAKLSDHPDWQWPVIYQIGRCFESLQEFEKAKDAYTLIVSGESWKSVKFEETKSLSEIKNNAAWRLDHLKWLQSAKSKVGELLNPTLPDAKPEKVKA